MLALYALSGHAPPADLAPAPGHKYGAKVKVVDGIRFDSSGEARMWGVLRAWESMKVITHLERQVRYLVHDAYTHPQTGQKVRAVAMVPDFRFRRDGALVVADFKGILTPEFRIKRKMFEERYPGIVFEVWDRKRVTDAERGR